MTICHIHNKLNIYRYISMLYLNFLSSLRQ